MLKDIAPKGKARAVGSARRLRKAMSLPEVLLWRGLRRHPLGLKFRRQHPSGLYVLDFYCGDARLAVEIDGVAHDTTDRARRDEIRDAWLSGAGIETIRIAAVDVLQDPDHVIEAIVLAARARLPLHHPAVPDGPPPRDKLGEDL